jgi:hypothetical protein
LRSLIIALIVLALPATATTAHALSSAPVARAAAVCADYPNQAAAQRAAGMADADGDGIYCVISPSLISRSWR